jgi:hypothetical protein
MEIAIWHLRCQTSTPFQLEAPSDLTGNVARHLFAPQQCDPRSGDIRFIA